MIPSPKSQSKTLISRTIFFIILVVLVLHHTVFNFNGLTSRVGIDHAQAAREVAQGYGLRTQLIRPQQLKQLRDHGKDFDIHQVPETFHSPLNIMVLAGVLKLIGADNMEAHELNPNDEYYVPDQAIALTCAIFFIVSIGINYVLISRIFDTKIASCTAIIMASSSVFWNLTQSGLPQMLMLTLFSTALCITWSAIEQQKAGLSPTKNALLAAFAFGLLALSHWLTVWIFIAYFIFTVFYFSPRGTIALGVAAVFTAVITPSIIYYSIQTGETLGTAFYAIHGASGASDAVLRQFNDVSFNVQNLLATAAHGSLYQISHLGTYLGAAFLAPAFFLCLAHPFRRPLISVFRWILLLLWVFSVLGMGVYGVSYKMLEPGQLHILFVPLMTAYALALLSIIWSRCELSKQGGAIGNLHLIIVTIIACFPLLLNIRSQIRENNQRPVVNGVDAYILNSELRKLTTSSDIIVSDQPWAVAWYANRTTIWLPINTLNLNAVEAYCQKLGHPIAGIHITGSSNRGMDIKANLNSNRDLAALSFAPWMANFARVPQNQLLMNNPSLAELIGTNQGRYKYIYPLVSGTYEPAYYYSSRDLSRN